MSARDELARDLTRMKRVDLRRIALALVETRGAHYVIGGPKDMSKDELIAYIVGDQGVRSGGWS